MENKHPYSNGFALYNALLAGKNDAYQYLSLQVKYKYSGKYSASDVEDIQGETMLRFLKKFPQAVPQENPVGLFFGIAKNVSHEMNHKTQNKESKAKSFLSRLWNKLEEAVKVRRRRKMVEQALPLLSKDVYRDIIRLRVLDGYEYDEIVEQQLMPYSKGTLKNLYSEAKAELSRLVKNADL